MEPFMNSLLQFQLVAEINETCFKNIGSNCFLFGNEDAIFTNKVSILTYIVWEEGGKVHLKRTAHIVKT